MLKADPRLLWDQFDQTASTIDERPPDDPVEAIEDLDSTMPESKLFGLHNKSLFKIFNQIAYHLK